MFEDFEQQLQQQGFHRICGIDEAGRGPLAGPVTAAAVILGDWWDPRINDSKKISPKLRHELYNKITENCAAWSVISVDHEEIDRINIYRATAQAMLQVAVAIRADYCLIDAMPLPELTVPSRSIIHGDAVCRSIAAASILAKETRDRIMISYALAYPDYGFEKHKGYGTALHMKMLQENGPCPIHRKSFRPIRDML